MKTKNGFLNDDERILILHIHNTYRNTAAFGIPETNNMLMADVNVLNYDKELEFVAQCWTNSCKLGKDACRSTSKFEDVTQNNYVGRASRNSTRWITNALDEWWSQRELLSKPQGDFDPSNIEAVNNMLWSGTTHIGCGRTIYNYRVVFACNYAPSWVFDNDNLALRGPPCSNCSSGMSCNKEFRGLCGYVEKIENYDPPFELKGSLISWKMELLMVFLGLQGFL